MVKAGPLRRRSPLEMLKGRGQKSAICAPTRYHDL